MLEGLDPLVIILLFGSIFAVCAFEFVNGFHDTANAVATVIYTNSLKPQFAVVWSGVFNFLGVLVGGVGVAMGIVNLLPIEVLLEQNIMQNLSMVFAILAAAIMWNLGTWYFGIPCSSSHTLIGSILGVGIANMMMGGPGANWSKAGDIGLSLLFSPILGFSVAAFLMFVLRFFTKGDAIFLEPEKDKVPPIWIRAILVLTCTSVSFSHGSNDGQKGVGLIMLILISVLPIQFALNLDRDFSEIKNDTTPLRHQLSEIDSTKLSEKERISLRGCYNYISSIEKIELQYEKAKKLTSKEKVEVRRDILMLNKNLDKLFKSGDANIPEQDMKKAYAELKDMKTYTDYAPRWVTIIISLSLGIGTMIGWKRIVVTIGEKIGKEHLSFAQGASSEIVAASTIGLSSYFGLPVSTTHCLTSGVAGSMVASKGMKNLQFDTIKSMVIAWVLTLPVCVVTSGALYFLFKWMMV